MATTSVAAAAEESWITPRHPNPDNTADDSQQYPTAVVAPLPNCTAVRRQWQSKKEEEERRALFVLLLGSWFFVLFVDYSLRRTLLIFIILRYHIFRLPVYETGSGPSLWKTIPKGDDAT